MESLQYIYRDTEGVTQLHGCKRGALLPPLKLFFQTVSKLQFAVITCQCSVSISTATDQLTWEASDLNHLLFAPWPDPTAAENGSW